MLARPARSAWRLLSPRDTLDMQKEVGMADIWVLRAEDRYLANVDPVAWADFAASAKHFETAAAAAEARESADLPDLEIVVYVPPAAAVI